MTVDENGRLTSDPRYPDWADWTGAVLLSNEIIYYAADPAIPLAQRLIVPFDEQSLEAARYNLRLGPEYRMQGQAYALSDKEPWLRLLPHQMALVETLEEVRLPRFLIARWNLKVPRVYEGLLWVGALQVDPGWQGHLSCPIYNMSNSEVRLKFKDELFAMDFVRTTPYVAPSSKAYLQKPDVGESGSVHSYDRVGLRSGPFEALAELRDMREELSTFRGQSYIFVTVIVAVFAALIAALSVVAVGPVVKPGGPLLSGWPMTALVGAAVAFVLSAVSLVVSLKKGFPQNRNRTR